jgi:hypothetical protein
MEQGAGNPYSYSEDSPLYMGASGTDNFSLFGDAFYYTFPNGSGFGVIPFALTTSSTSANYRYFATDNTTNSSFVEGNYRCQIFNYQGKIVFISGNGSYQVIQNGIGTASSNFTRLDNVILPITNQTLTGISSFENRLLFITEEGYLLYSPINWDGTSGWLSDAANLGGAINVINTTGERLETIRVGRSGIVITSRNSARVAGNIYNINTLNVDQLIVRNTGQNAYFSKGGLVALDDNLYGITPQGLLNVGIDSLTLTAVAKNESSAISEYMIELFKDDTIYNILDSFLDTKSKTAYYIVGSKLRGNILETEVTLLTYQFDLKKWTRLKTNMPIQRLFMYYGTPSAAGYFVNPVTNHVFLGVWSLSPLFKDTFVDVETSGGNYYWDYSTTSTPYTKYILSGNLNLSGGKTGGNGDNRSIDNVLTFYSNEEVEYEAGMLYYSARSAAGVQDLLFTSESEMQISKENRWADTGTGAKFAHALKVPFFINERSYPMKRSSNIKYQLWLKSDSDAEITIIDLSMDNTKASG